MSWGVELWDKFEDVLGHTQKGVDISEKFAQFTKERCNIELEYAHKLKRLVKSFLPKKKEDDELTSSKGFLAMLKEMNDIAGQHETISESLQATVLSEAQNLSLELKQERKKAMQDSSKHLSSLQNQFSQLDRVKKNYEKAFREMEKASDSSKKANEDQSLSRNEVEKSKQYYQQKMQSCDQSKHEYAAEVQKTNAVQREHYNSLMPQVFDNLEVMEQKRVAKIKGLIIATAEIEKSTCPILNQCIEDMTKAASVVSFEQEKRMLIDSLKTGFVIPTDIPFEEVSSSTISRGPIHGTLHGTLSGKKDKKRPGILGILAGSKDDGIPKDDFSHLPPNQQKRQLAAKIDDLKAALAKESLERDALLKMQDVYKQNSSLGDPRTIDKKLDEKSQKMDQLGNELKKYEDFMAEANKGPGCKANTLSNTNNSTSAANTIAPLRNLESPQSPNKAKGKPMVSKKPSGTNSQRNSRVETETETRKSVNLTPMFPTSPPGASKLSTSQAQESFDDDDEFIDGAICTATYDFDGSAEGSLAMTAGSELTVVERDEGDGWVLVRKEDGQQGYVPATYIKYND